MSIAALEFDRASIVFGDAPERALPLMDQGLDRAEVAARSGQTLGVHDCSLTLHQGEILVLMGLSGSGKSTLLRGANGLNPVIRGEIRLRQGNEMISVTHASPARLRELRRNAISMVFQQFGLLPWRSVAENVALGLELSGLPAPERRARSLRQLELVGLADWAERKVSELSGGMQQRVGLARAFATEAPILLMDEPFSALDPLIRRRLQDELLALQSELKRSILFVSHDLDEAFRIGNRIALMEGGRIVQCGTAEEIIANPANDHVRAFVADMNPLEVLTARQVMQPGDARPASGEIPPGAPIRAVMEALAAGTTTLAVVDGGKRLGTIEAPQVMARLLGQRAA